MEISLFQEDEPLQFERIILYPYPDLKRIWTRIWVTAKQDQVPNIDIRILNPDSSEDSSIFLLAQTDQKIDRTIHMRDPVPGAIYHVIAELSTGMGDDLESLDRREFDMILEFRNPEEKQPGFGFGVNWDEYQRSV
ncbi:MAG: hypothetical protein AAF702_27880 [Chloroflexota bacterium]